MGMGEKIRQRRLQLKMTQDELAAKIGVQKSAVAKYESGRVQNIKRAMISTLAKALECDPVWLMDLDSEELLPKSEGEMALYHLSREVDPGLRALQDKVGKLSMENRVSVEIFVDALLAKQDKEKEEGSAG